VAKEMTHLRALLLLFRFALAAACDSASSLCFMFQFARDALKFLTVCVCSAVHFLPFINVYRIFDPISSCPTLPKKERDDYVQCAHKKMLRKEKFLQLFSLALPFSGK
jgi:hypothetical protein